MSRSTLRREAHMKGEPQPEFDECDEHDLTALHEAATPAPWDIRNQTNIQSGHDTHSRSIVSLDGHSDIEWFVAAIEDDLDESDANAALIVALRNAYASGDLVPREKVEELEARIATAESALEIQGGNGNWNYDPYMHGMYNGMEYVLALVRGREFECREAPDQWLCDAAREDTSLCEKVEELERMVEWLAKRVDCAACPNGEWDDDHTECIVDGACPEKCLAAARAAVKEADDE